MSMSIEELFKAQKPIPLKSKLNGKYIEAAKELSFKLTLLGMPPELVHRQVEQYLKDNKVDYHLHAEKQCSICDIMGDTMSRLKVLFALMEALDEE